MITLLVFLAIALVEMSSDIYVPGLPYLMEVFNTDQMLIKLTISLNLVGIAVSSLFYGVLSDSYGRRRIFLIGFSIFTIASLLCCFADNIMYLIIMRFAQGCGAGVAAVVGHASIKDIYSGPEYTKIVSKLSMIISLSPAIAPIIGGFILSKFDWRFLFIITLIIAIVELIMLFMFFQETSLAANRHTLKFSSLLKSYNLVLTNKTFIAMCCIQAVTFMWLWNEIANLPFLFITTMGMKIQHYGYFVAISVFAYIVGTIINQKYASKISTNNMLLIGILMCIWPDILLLIMNLFMKLNPVVVVIVWIPSLIGLALIITNSIAIALSSVPRYAIARASACLTFTQMISGSIAIYIISILFTGNSIIPISAPNVILSIIAFLIYNYVYKRNNLPISKTV